MGMDGDGCGLLCVENERDCMFRIGEGLEFVR